ncbi:Fatty acid hydroxylase superfamily protein [Aquimixticola soesokkakensis]|uniref:Fatty acid hydroxylase superfamily protein n=1 Tax=Aquimixticola soesokkakensis TaxID=1519096 RepID=A0A1Y5TEP3_9RHOB|nr:sterol desaturase family protein [Aquimixticola soesokkakensis]SLN62358.1 Fatty acid hydroxylase superfamily protein [Aquimixticola soesokkakensis]
MDDLKFGTRDKRGNWRPNEALGSAPLFVWPWSISKFIRWLPGYFLPWNALFFAIAAVFWFFMTPARETMQDLTWGWPLYLLARNAALVIAFYGFLETRLYIKRRQGTSFKYNAKFPAEHPSDVFMFKSQNIDNIIRTFGTGLPIWTAYEVLLLWAWSNDVGPWAVFSLHPVWLIFVGLILPIFHEFHFYCIHRLIHTPLLYKWVHSVHHNSINPSPWSSLSMHPVEHLLYWSGTLIHLIVPSHPLLLLYHLQLSGTGAVVGHVGFDKLEAGEDSAVTTHAYAHYLHHKYFEVNYADGMMPLDRWMGTWHDGTPEGDQIMKERFRRKKARANAAKGTTPAE